MAYMRSRSKLEQAKQDGVVDLILDEPGSQLGQCDIIFLCTPVEYNAGYLEAIRPFLKEGALITDVGSTKTSIHQAARQLIRRITEDARQIGYRCMLLDTLPVLEDAVRLYRQLGFYEIPCYNDSPVESTLFFQLDL